MGDARGDADVATRAFSPIGEAENVRLEYPRRPKRLNEDPRNPRLSRRTGRRRTRLDLDVVLARCGAARVRFGPREALLERGVSLQPTPDVWG